MIVVDVGFDTVVLSLGASADGMSLPLVLFNNHRAANAGAPAGVPESVQAAAMHVAGVLAAAELHLGEKGEEHAAG